MVVFMYMSQIVWLQVANLPKGALVEIEAVAILGEVNTNYVSA